jgi:hypothetical protein
MNTKASNHSSENDIATFRRIRSAIGMLGISLPILLLILPLFPFFQTSIQQSISHYYYTNLRELFTGVLCAVGLFLIRYKGHENPVFWKNDSRLTNIAGLMAFGIALFPTDANDCSQKVYTLIPSCETFLGTIHFVFAAIFFFVLAIVSINVFTIGQKANTDIAISPFNENTIYRTCGYLMICFIILIPILPALGLSYTTLICEALALFAFGISWLIKGRALGDKGKMGEKIYREKNI